MTRGGSSAAAGSASALAASNLAVADASKRARADRLRYLMALAPMFSHFIHADELRAAGIKPADEKESKKNGKGARTRMTESEEDRLMLESSTAAGAALLDEQTTRLRSQPANVTGKMRDYQVDGLNFLIGLFERGLNGILADEMGLGKTLQTISMLAFLRLYKDITGPHLIIVPKSTLGNWMNEIKRWCPDIRAVRFHGSADQRKEIADEQIQIGKFDVVCTTYEVVMREKNTLTKISWRYLIIDEAHRIKNENSLLSQVVRLFKTQARLLITGTPLQNNLHELWALLNFLLPDVFSRSQDFDEWFSSVETIESDADEKKRKTEIVTQLHAVLRPFLIRRLKSEVEHSLPPKKETVLFTKLSDMQLQLYRNLLKKDIDAINGKGGERVRLLNILMQLRKCVNHPYLFEGEEDRTLDPFGDHVIKNCGKFMLLDRLLPRLQENGHRVLIFSQMTRVLDILEDYCTMKQYKFCRIDGQTDGEWRDEQIADYNREGSDKFIFLLSTRAGGLGINLATADTVILYDSDWNAQCDLQAMDRAHRIGQRKPVNVYRLITENSVEERILRTAMAKLRLDTLVIQQGRLSEQKKNLHKNELLDMIRFGADKFFKSNAESFADEDLDVILERGASKTKVMNEEIEEKVKASGGTLDSLDFNITHKDQEEKKSIFHFEGVNYKDQEKDPNKHFFLDVGKRVRSKNYDESAYFRSALNNGAAVQASDRKKQRLRYRKEPNVGDYMLCNVGRIKELYALERAAVDKFNEDAEKAAKEGKEVPEVPDIETLLGDELRTERETLFAESYRSWNRRDYHAFVRGMERNGRTSYDEITEEIGPSKTKDEVIAYAAAFWERGPKFIEAWEKVRKNIEDGELRIEKRKNMEVALDKKVKRYKDPWKDLDVVYGGSRSKTFIDEEDRWLVCMTQRLGYGRWEDVKLEVRRAWQFRFNWWLKSRTPAELKRRVDALIRLIEKENEEIEILEKQAEKRRAAAKRRRELQGQARAAGATPKPAAKKRKTEQTQLNAYFPKKPTTPGSK